MQQITVTPDQMANITAQTGPVRDGFYDPSAGVFWFGDTLAAAVLAAFNDQAAGLKTRLKGHAAGVRYDKEIAGVEVNGNAYPSDRASQAKFTAAAVMSQINPQASFNWKTDAGFVTLKAADMIAIAGAVGAYVQRCFDKESTVMAAIDAGTMTTTAEIDAAFAVV